MATAPGRQKLTTKKKKVTHGVTVPNAKSFVEKLNTYRSAAELKKYERYFKFSESKPLKGDQFVGVRMGQCLRLPKSSLIWRLQKLRNYSKARSTK